MSSVNTPFGALPGITPFTTTTTKACDPSYVSLTLKAGEKFVLPSGAKIISSTAGASALESDCADINVEVPECYIFVWGGAKNVSGNSTSMWSSDRTRFEGISLGSTYYGHPSPPIILGGNGGAVVSPVRDWIQNHPVLKNLLTCMGGNSSADSSGKERGGIGSLCFKTIPSVGEALTMHISTGGEGGDNGGGGPVFVLVEARTKAWYTSIPGTGRGVCSCTC